MKMLPLGVETEIQQMRLIPTRSSRLPMAVAAALLFPFAATLATSPAGADAQEGHSQAIYDSTVRPLPGNLVSLAFQAQQVSEFGNQIAFGGTARNLKNVVVTMSSWGCQSGNWNLGNCVTTPGSTFSEPITLNLYNVGPLGAVGSLIATTTKVFNIPYRPSAAGATLCPTTPEKWFSAKDNTCNNGVAVNISFKFSTQVHLPDSLIFGVAFNTSGYGATPYGYSTTCAQTPAGCGYDSLNVALATVNPQPAVGSDPLQGTTYGNSITPLYYCDKGLAGVGTFRLDSSTSACWGVSGDFTTAPWYVPAVRFNASGNGHSNGEGGDGNES